MSTKNNHVNNKTQLIEGKRRTELIRIQDPGGHKEGWASFPDEFTYKVFTNPWLKSLTLERRGEGQGGEVRQVQGEEGGCSPGKRRGPERERG